MTVIRESHSIAGAENDCAPNLALLSMLKAQWLADPCWDIEDTVGFEGCRQELLIFRLQAENNQLRQQLKAADDFRRQLRIFMGLDQ